MSFDGELAFITRWLESEDCDEARIAVGMLRYLRSENAALVRKLEQLKEAIIDLRNQVPDDVTRDEWEVIKELRKALR